MDSFPKVLISLLFSVTCSVLLLTACGGGGSGGDSSPSNNNVNSSNTLNNDLSGKLIFEYENNAWLMDMSLGQYRKIPNTDWAYHDNYFGNVDYFWLDMGPVNGDEFTVTTLYDCDIEDTTYATCVAIQDFSGNYLAHFRFLGEARSPAKLSFDNQYIAIMRQGIYSDDEELRIYDRSGQQISSRIVAANDFEWLENNTIIYAEDHKFVITDELSTTPHHELTLPSGLEGNIESIEVNPNSDKFAFTLITSGTDVSTLGTPWIVNTDGSALKQLAVSAPDSSQHSISSPRWSPDGNWILLKEGAYTGSGISNPGSSGYAYIVPAQDMGKTFVLSIIDSERSPEAFLLNRYDIIESNPSGTIVNKHFSDTPTWIP